MNEYEDIEKIFSEYSEVKEIYAENMEAKSYVYAIFDEQRKLLYMGQTKNIDSRFKQHQKVMPTAKICKYAQVSVDNVNDIEFCLVSRFLPPNNRSLPPRKSYFTLEEFQSIDSRFYSNRIGVLSYIKVFNVENTHGYYERESLDLISEMLDLEVSE